MGKRSFFLFVIVAMLVLAYGIAGASDENDSYHDTINTFFEKLSTGNYADAINFIYADNPWFSAKSDDVQKLKTQFIGLDKVVGDYLDNELLIEEKVASRFVFIQYFVAFGRQPLSFNFEFYKPKDKWLTFSFSYSDDIDQLIEEKAKSKFIDLEKTEK